MNEKHLNKLKEGVEAWNSWRRSNHLLRHGLRGADLIGADLRGANLIGVNLSRVNLRGANLIEADLIGAKLIGAKLIGAKLREADLIGAKLREVNLSRAKLREADLSQADLREADLSKADLRGADLRGANLSKADLREADLRKANLRKANLREANLIRTDLNGANLQFASFGFTIFSDAKIDSYHHLELVRHRGPSYIDTKTLERAQGQLPEKFLLGCGLKKWEILSAQLYNLNLSPSQITDIVYEVDRLRNENPLQIHNLFISYSRNDSAFVDCLEPYFSKKEISYWRDIHDAPAGPLESIVVRAMHHNPTVLLIFSKESVNSDWVEFEITKARKLEKELGRNVLCPIALDDSWENCGWSKVLMTQVRKYNVLDFSNWQDKGFLETQFNKLVKGLDLFYKRKE